MYLCGYCKIIINKGAFRVTDQPMICSQCKTEFKAGDIIFKHNEKGIFCYLPEDEMDLTFTKDQIRELFTFKKWMQDQLGIHWGHSTWHTLQDKDFLQDIINYAVGYWKQSKTPERIKEYFETDRKNLPRDYPADILDR